MTPDEWAQSDGEMLAELRGLRLRAELAPPVAVAAAVAAFSWRSVADAVAELEFDSVVDDDDQLARVRDDGAERRLRFVGAGRAIEVAVVDNNQALAGRVDPPLPGAMVLRHADGATSCAPVDEGGRFFFAAVRRGPVSLRPVSADGTLGDFETEWVTI